MMPNRIILNEDQQKVVDEAVKFLHSDKQVI